MKKKNFTVIDGFQQINFDSIRKAYKYCETHNISLDSIFIDER